MRAKIRGSRGTFDEVEEVVADTLVVGIALEDHHIRPVEEDHRNHRRSFVVGIEDHRRSIVD